VLKDTKPVVMTGMSITNSDWEVLKGFIADRGITSLVEFGAGVSTELFDKAGVKVHSFETIPEVANQTKKKVPNADIDLWDGKTPVTIHGDMAFIDGPHGGKNREASYRSVAESSIPIVACHDMAREEDRQWLDKYFMDWKPRIGTNDLLILERPHAEV
jgi:hypothetical protein